MEKIKRNPLKLESLILSKFINKHWYENKNNVLWLFKEMMIKKMIVMTMEMILKRKSYKIN